MTAYRDLQAHYFEVLIVGSDDLRPALDSSYVEATAAFSEILDGKNRWSIPAAHFADLVEAMKADLGYAAEGPGSARTEGQPS
jgi:hypothetical protein